MIQILTYDLTEEQRAAIEAACPGLLGDPTCRTDERLVFSAQAAREAIDEEWIYNVPDRHLERYISDDGIYRAWWEMLDQIRNELGPDA